MNYVRSRSLSLKYKGLQFTTSGCKDVGIKLDNLREWQKISSFILLMFPELYNPWTSNIVYWHRGVETC